jgi:hypothetical protein
MSLSKGVSAFLSGFMLSDMQEYFNQCLQEEKE